MNKTFWDHETSRAWSILLAVLVILTLYRGLVIQLNHLPLYLDEAQYWVWSLKPAFGYYSKPPMVAWVIDLFSWAGDSAFAVKLGALILHPLTALVLFFLGRSMFNAKTALAAALLFISLPLVGFNSLFMTTDAPLFLFWGLSVYALWQALQHNRWRDWLLLGVAAGLGLLSKYSMAVFAPSVVLLLCFPAYRQHWKNPRLYLAAVLALLIYLPNFLWNAQMDFVSFKHTAEISKLDQGLFHPNKLLEFVSGQFGVMGPIGFACLIIALCSPKVWRDPKLSYLAAMTLPFLGVISLQALLAKANVNWAAPTFFAGTLLVAAQWMAAERHRLWLTAIVINLALLSVFYHYRPLAQAFGVTLKHDADPYSRVRGWPEMGQSLSPILLANSDAHLAVLDRGDFSLLSFYAHPHPEGVRIWNPEGHHQNHFHLVADMKNDLGNNFVFVTEEPLTSAVKARFTSCHEVGLMQVPLYPDFALKRYVNRCDHFLGYR